LFALFRPEINTVIDSYCRLPIMSALLSSTKFFIDTLFSVRGGSGDARMSNRRKPPSRRPHGAEWLRVAEQDAPLGSHVVTPRRGYLHHGIHVGDGKVVHYAGLARGLQRGPVEEISLTLFSGGRPIWIRSHAPSAFDAREVIRRARSRVGEDCYRLFTNNCEHFCEWCLRGEPRSYQVEAWLVRPASALHATIRSIAQPFSPPPGVGPRPADSPAAEA
jgi:hypothetical protein